MDPLSSLHTKKDSTLAMINAAQKKGLEVFYLEQRDVFLSGDKIMGSFRTLKIDPQILEKKSLRSALIESIFSACQRSKEFS